MNLNTNQINYGLIKEENFPNNHMQKLLDNNDILMCSTYNKGKSVVAERFIKTMKVKIYKKWQLIIVNLILVI